MAKQTEKSISWWYDNNHKQIRLDGNIERVNGKVNLVDVSIKNVNKLKQGVDLLFTIKSNNSDDDVLNNLDGLVDVGSDYSGF